MPISEDEFIERYPTLYHVSLAGDLEQIRRHGVRSVTALLDLFEITGEERRVLESCRRRSMVTIRHSVHGEATLNDQAPLNETVLGRCLIGMASQEWCANLNRRVFLWPDIESARRFLNARMARERKRLVLAIQASDLLRVADAIELSAINSGTAVRNAPIRGRETFLPLSLYPYEERRQRHGTRRAIAEVTALYAIHDAGPFYPVDLSGPSLGAHSIAR